MISSRQITRGGGVALILLVGFILGAALVILPLKLSLMAWGTVLFLALCFVVLKLPDNLQPSYKIIYALFAIAVASKFLWPGFAYLPIGALPTKNPQRMMWALAIMYWAYSLATSKELRERLGRRLFNYKLAWMVGLFFAWRYLTALTSVEPLYSLLNATTETFDHLPLFLFALTWIRDSDDVRRISVWLTLVIIAMAGVVGVEVLMQKNVFSALIPASELNEAMLEAKFRGGEYRAQGTFNHPILMAQFVVSILPLVLLLRFEARPAIRRLGLAALMLIPVLVLFAKSRSGYAILAVIISVIGVLMVLRSMANKAAPRIAIISYAFIPFILCSVLAVSAFIASVTAGRDRDEARSSYARVQMVEQSSKLAQEEPIVGYGPGVGGHKLGFVAGKGRLSLDSYFLVLLLDSGVPAVLLFLSTLGGAVVICVSNRRGGNESRRISEAYLLSMVSWVGFSLILGTAHNLALFFLAAGVLICLSDIGVQYSPDRGLKGVPNFKKGSSKPREDNLVMRS